MSLFSLKLIAALTIMMITALAVYYPLRQPSQEKHSHTLDFCDAFASGVFLGAALFHLLPTASALFVARYPTLHYPLAALLCVAGFLLLLFLERLTLSTTKNNVTVPYVLSLVIITHSLIEGAVIGINTQLATLSFIFLAILAHKSSESLAFSLTLRKTNLTRFPLLLLISLFVVATPFAILISTMTAQWLQAAQGQLITAGFNALAAGTFLYMSTLHHISHHQRMHEAENMTEFAFLLLGASIMALIAGWA